MRVRRPLRPWVRLVGVRLLAFVALSAAAARGAEEGSPDLDKLRTEMDLLWLDGSSDHARVRREAFDESVRAFAPLLRKAVAEHGVSVPRIDDGSRPAAARAITASSLASHGAAHDEEAPLRKRTLEFLLLRALPADLAAAAADHDDAWFATFLAGEARSLLAADRFEDAWDAVYRDAPAVAAWRAAHAGTATPAPPVETRPASEAVLADLVAIDAARAWVGPWTGWNTEIREKDNRRQKRPSKSVWIERHEVTCEAWREHVRALAPTRRAAALPAGWTLDAAGEPSFPKGRERHPVTGVSFAQALQYAEARGMRLPTEDEWDRAAGGGEKEGRTFPWGLSSEGKRWAHLGVGPEGTTPVDAWPDDATPDGVLGLAGNAAEWTATLADRRDVPKGGPAPEEQVVVRGGSFRAREVECAATYRRLLEAGKRPEHVGFRCVMDDAEYRRRTRSGAEAR